MEKESESTGSNFYSLFEEDNPHMSVPNYSEMVNQEGVALIQEEYSKLFDLEGEALTEEINTYGAILKFKIGSKLDLLDLNPEFAPLLKPVLIFLNVLKLNNKGNPLKPEIKETDYDLLKILTYKSLLLAVSLEEAREMLKALAYVLSLNAKDNNLNADLAKNVFATSSKVIS